MPLFNSQHQNDRGIRWRGIADCSGCPVRNLRNDPSLDPLNHWARSKMEYRGKHYTIVQGIGPDSWRWTVDLDENTVKSGRATSRAAAMSKVVWLIDKALKKANPKPPTTSKWS